MEEVDGNHVVFISGRWILDDLEVTGWNMLEPMEPEKSQTPCFYILSALMVFNILGWNDLGTQNLRRWDPGIPPPEDA